MALSRTALLCVFATTLLLAGCASTAKSASGPTSRAAAPATTAQTQTSQTQTSSAAPAPVASAPPASPPGLTPAGVVEAYFAAVNSRDYTEAWSLGGDNLGQSYGTFVAGFADTAEDTVDSLSANGANVAVQFTATNTDGTTAGYAGTYTVTGQAITGASIAQVAGPPPQTLCGAPANPYGYNYCGSGGKITSPPQDICDYFSCIDYFQKGNGYMVECEDGMVSMSGGFSEACNDHGGVKQQVYSGG
ncbi:MAG TPA: hypothetical protein VGM10_07760 [Actinocrinis sp.]|jgi:PBP1b-binding outer membrane lipoprotein LpoB